MTANSVRKSNQKCFFCIENIELVHFVKKLLFHHGLGKCVFARKIFVENDVKINGNKYVSDIMETCISKDLTKLCKNVEVNCHILLLLNNDRYNRLFLNKNTTRLRKNDVMKTKLIIIFYISQ